MVVVVRRKPGDDPCLRGRPSSSPRNDLPYPEGNALFSLTKASHYGEVFACALSLSLSRSPLMSLLPQPQYFTPSYVGSGDPIP